MTEGWGKRWREKLSCREEEMHGEGVQWWR